MLKQTALDLDGVIFNYEKSFQKEAAKLNLNISIKHPEIYNMAERYQITPETVSLINSKIDFSNMEIYDEVLFLKNHIKNIKCFITSSPEDIIADRMNSIRRVFGKDIPLYRTGFDEKHKVISELGIKYFIDDYNGVIHHIEQNCPACKAVWLNRGYKDETLPEPANKINSLTEFFESIGG